MSITQVRKKRAEIARAEKAKELSQLTVVATGTTYRGICAVCKKAPTCIYPKDPEAPYLFCGEFEAYALPEDKTNGKNGSQKTMLQVRETNLAEPFVGLCANCEKRYSCTFPKPESGVWHCEEYE